MSSSAKTLRPCIVLGLETQIGLAIVRELGRAGVPVIGIAHDTDAIGLASRYLTRKLVVLQPRSPELINVIRGLGEEFGACCLLTVSEANLSWLAKHHGEFGNVRPSAPNADILAIVLDKQRTLQAAVGVGIAVPVTEEPASMEQVQALASSFRFPAVLKWKDPNKVAARLRAIGLSLIKAEYVQTPEHFLEAAGKYAPLGEWPILQSYCPGRGLGQFFYMHRGQAVRRFQHVRIAEWPPEGGFSSVCEAVTLDQHVHLQDRSIALLKHIGWEGVAMVEYRWDETTDSAVLMEINGRYWGSYPLAEHCNAGFGLLAYHVGSDLPLPQLPPPRQDIRCRMVATEIKRLMRIFFRPTLIADKTFQVKKLDELTRFVVDFFRLNVRYYVWSLVDPLPFFADVRNYFAKRR